MSARDLFGRVFWILDGHTPIPVADILTWGRWLETTDRHVAKTELGGVFISTVFIGLDHQYGDGPPLLFETMIFGGPHDGYCERYSTWDDADAGHTHAVQLAADAE